MAQALLPAASNRASPAAEPGRPQSVEAQKRALDRLMVDLAPMQDALDLPQLFAALARAVRNAVRADACVVSLLDGEHAILRDIGASVRPGMWLNTIREEYPLAEYPVTREVIDLCRAREVARRAQDRDQEEVALLAKLGFARVLIFPIAVDGAVIGIGEAYRSEDRPFRHDDPEHVAILATFAANAYSKISLAAQLESQYTTTIELLTSALEARDPYTEAHAGRIRSMAMALADATDAGPEVRRAVRLGSILHDVGKIGISDSILLKEGGLDEDEWQIMRSHPLIGERMLSGIDFLSPALPVVRHHHERWDGSGYPDGFHGEQIPLAARIVTVCDAFDAMTSDRPYRRGLSIVDARERLVAASGTQFDPAQVRNLVELVDREGDNLLREESLIAIAR